MAGMVNMSSSYFSQCFKEIVGQTYTDYLREIRMQRAQQYLRNTTKTIQWIAEQVGYNDEKYFSRLFREQVGVLPSEFRQVNSG
ncbi:HTH-type transcriptional regulator YesS [compost metagenome]